MKPKKSLGQNFLTSEAAVYKIIEAAKIIPGETVLEVGPGRGVLTKSLLAAGAKVVAIEKDHTLIAELSEKFASEISTGQINIIEGDALDFEPENIGLKKGIYKIVANIPYYITGQFLRKFLSNQDQPKHAVVLLQKEVVERIVATDKKESILSVSVKVYGEPRKVGVVKSGSFFPAPNVDSAILSIENINKNFFNLISEEKFFKIIHAGFAHKRKKLASNLANLGSAVSKTKIAAAFANAQISENARAEDVTLDQWQKIAQKL